MAKIKSTRTAILIAKEQISGTILIEVNSPTLEILSGQIRCTINYFFFEEMKHIGSETWILTNDKVSTVLLAFLNNPESLDELLSNFLLERFQENSAFGILPEEWIISDESFQNKSNTNEKSFNSETPLQ